MGVTWLHISDFHIRGGDPYDRDVVLRALVASVAEYRRKGRAPDLIFATGDVAHAGKPAEYAIATRFFDELLAAAGLDKSRLFVIPGNHDVDREFGVGLSRTLDSREEADRYFHPARPNLHLTQKLGAYLDWHNGYFAGIRAAPANTTCYVQEAEIGGRRLGILLMNSALFCLDDEDHNKLWIGRRCLDAELERLRKCEVRLALVHHPLEWLSPNEGANIRNMLEANVHVLLRGHLHDTRIEIVGSADGQVLHCAAGAAYQSRRWPNCALYGTLEADSVTLVPIRYEDSPREFWTTDPSVFPDGASERTFRLGRHSATESPKRQESRPAPRFRSNVPARGTRPFVGRQDLLEKILTTFDDTAQERVLIIQGHAGVGKSDLAKEFARLHKSRYEGGTFVVDASKEAIAIDLARIGKNILDLDFPTDLPLADQGQQTFYALAAAPALLIYDNVVSFESTAPWLPPSGMPCHVLITTLVDNPTPHWPRIDVPLLTPEESEALVTQLGGGAIAPRDSRIIAERGGGLPVQIVPDAVSFASATRRGRPRSEEPGLAREANASFQAVYDRLQQPARLFLFTAAFLNSQRIPLSELTCHLNDSLNWTEADVGRALDACLDLHLLEGNPDPSMHQLFASFLRQAAASDEDRVKIRRAQARRFVELAISLARNPADTERATKFLSYPLDPVSWSGGGLPSSIGQSSEIGRALYEIGRFEQALPWILAVVAQRERPDDKGAIDHENLGVSLHRVGACLSRTGRYEEARPWFERAVGEAEKGDVHGRIDHESLGASLHQVGYCLSRMQRYEEALAWFERAVAEIEKGDKFRRIDPALLAMSLRSLAECLRRLGLTEQAQEYDRRASELDPPAGTAATSPN